MLLGDPQCWKRPDLHITQFWVPGLEGSEFSSTFSDDELKKAYRQAVRRSHPDAPGGRDGWCDEMAEFGWMDGVWLCGLWGLMVFCSVLRVPFVVWCVVWCVRMFYSVFWCVLQSFMVFSSVYGVFKCFMVVDSVLWFNGVLKYFAVFHGVL